MICGRPPNKCRTNPKSISRITVRWHFSHVKQYNSQASNVSLSTWGFAIKSWWYWAIPGASKVFMKKLRNLYNFNVCVFAPGLQRLHYWTPFWMAFWKGLFLHQKKSGSKWSEHVLCWCPVVNVVFGGEGLVGGWRVDFTSTTCLWSHLVYGLFCTLKTFWKKKLLMSEHMVQVALYIVFVHRFWMVWCIFMWRIHRGSSCDDCLLFLSGW